MVYDQGHDGVLNATHIQPFHVLVSAESTPGTNLTFCADEPDCVSQSKTYLGVDVTQLKSFPSTFYYGAKGSSGWDASDTKCGIAVRGDGSGDCSPDASENCAASANALSNWICNLSANSNATDCSAPSDAWKRCL